MIDSERCEELIQLLREKGLKIAAAESCTGGAFMSALVKVPGASETVVGGVVAYSEDAKIEFLGVRRNYIEEFGAVSREVAIEMAKNVKRKLGADIGIGITGYAGPGNERDGEVCFAIANEDGVFSVPKKFEWMVREEVIDASVAYLVEILVEMLEAVM